MNSDKIHHIVPGHSYDTLYPLQVTLEFKKETIDQINVLRKDIFDTVKETLQRISTTPIKIDVEVINQDVEHIPYEIEILPNFNPIKDIHIDQYTSNLISSIFYYKIRGAKLTNRKNPNGFLDFLKYYTILTELPEGYRLFGTISDRYSDLIDIHIHLSELNDKIDLFHKHISKVIIEESIHINELTYLSSLDMSYQNPLQSLSSGLKIEYTAYLDQMEYIKRS